MRLLIVDDHELFAKGLQYIIESLADDIDVIGIAANGEEALATAASELIDVILMDVRMPVMDGVETTKLLRKLYPDVRIIMLTTFDDDEYVHQAIKHVAAGYLLKSIRPKDLVYAIRSAMSGQYLFDGKLHPFAVMDTIPVTETEEIINSLSRRETGTGTHPPGKEQPSNRRRTRALRSQRTKLRELDLSITGCQGSIRSHPED